MKYRIDKSDSINRKLICKEKIRKGETIME